MKTHGSGRFDSNLRHADVCPVEVFDGLGCFIGRLVADISDPPLRDQLNVGNLSVLRGEVLSKLGLRETGWQTRDEDARCFHDE